jgi:hypothetical protein
MKNQNHSIRHTRLFRSIASTFGILLTTCVFSLPQVFALDPPPDGGYPNENTAEGEDALFSQTDPRIFGNTALGFQTTYSTTGGSENTAIGAEAMHDNYEGDDNVAVGWKALRGNLTGSGNIAIGPDAMAHNTTGSDNVAIGNDALLLNTTEYGNVAIGNFAAYGVTGTDNVAVGDRTLANTIEGDFNTALGYAALTYCSGSYNTAVGVVAGVQLTTGSHNIDIGNQGQASDDRTIRIGNTETQKRAFIAGIRGATVADGVTVMIGSDGRLGTTTSSTRYKEAIKPMDKESGAILSLTPVSFRYKKDLDPKGIPQFGLVAEDVAKVDPDLVAKDEEGKPYTVRYEAVNAMLLNEFLKEHKKVEEQTSKIERLENQLQQVTARLDAKGL